VYVARKKRFELLPSLRLIDIRDSFEKMSIIPPKILFPYIQNGCLRLPQNINGITLEIKLLCKNKEKSSTIRNS
jgi:hypothetical protein